MRISRPTILPGFTTLELMISIAITGMVAVGISGMLAAVSQAVGSRQDSRSMMVRAHGAQTRLAGYIAPSRSLLSATTLEIVLWLDDSRESGTVHATEIRWLRYDTTEGGIDVSWVELPQEWTQVQRDLADFEYAPGQNWTSVFNYYTTNDWMLSLRLADGLDWAVFTTDAVDPLDARHVLFDLAITTRADPLVQTVSSTIVIHQPPS